MCRVSLRHFHRFAKKDAMDYLLKPETACLPDRKRKKIRNLNECLNRLPGQHIPREPLTFPAGTQNNRIASIGSSNRETAWMVSS